MTVSSFRFTGFILARWMTDFVGKAYALNDRTVVNQPAVPNIEGRRRLGKDFGVLAPALPEPSA
jgi:hypothetical protein